jgi:hypothetical protein
MVVYAKEGIKIMNISNLTGQEQGSINKSFEDTALGEVPVIQVSFEDHRAFMKVFYMTSKLRKMYGGCILRNT